MLRCAEEDRSAQRIPRRRRLMGVCARAMARKPGTSLTNQNWSRNRSAPQSSRVALCRGEQRGARQSPPAGHRCVGFRSARAPGRSPPRARRRRSAPAGPMHRVPPRARPHLHECAFLRREGTGPVPPRLGAAPSPVRTDPCGSGRSVPRRHGTGGPAVRPARSGQRFSIGIGSMFSDSGRVKPKTWA